MKLDRHPGGPRPNLPLAAPRAVRRSGAGFLSACLLAAALAGCASPPSRFYTLSPGDTAAPETANPPLLIELAPIDMPPQVMRNQLVVQRSEIQVDVLEQERWASLPSEEVRRALSGNLTRRLGTMDVYGAPHPNGVPVYRISVNMQRFESWPGSHALLDAVWSVRSLRTQNVMTCRSVLSEPAGDDYGQLVEAHRRAVEALSASLAAAVQALAQRGTAATPCP